MSQKFADISNLDSHDSPFVDQGRSATRMQLSFLFLNRS